MSSTSQTRGIFIAVEGIDGAGTTTFAQGLSATLAASGLAVHRTAEPSTGPVGRLLRELLKSADTPDPAVYALLFAADRRHHWLTEILPNLQKGTWVITDRYVLSSLAYQGIDEDVAWVSHCNARAPLPGVTFFLDLPFDVAQARIQNRGGLRENLEDADFQEKVAQRYRDLSRNFGSSLVTLDAGLPPQHLVRAALMELSMRGLLPG
jgi:dTMP kinase